MLCEVWRVRWPLPRPEAGLKSHDYRFRSCYCISNDSFTPAIRHASVRCFDRCLRSSARTSHGGLPAAGVVLVHILGNLLSIVVSPTNNHRTPLTTNTFKEKRVFPHSRAPFQVPSDCTAFFFFFRDVFFFRFLNNSPIQTESNSTAAAPYNSGPDSPSRAGANARHQQTSPATGLRVAQA